MNTILIGFKSCGKTYFGKKLAEHLSLPFIETDSLIEKEYALFSAPHPPLSCREIHMRVGEEGFRVLETQALASLQNVQNSIISVGGGMILHRSNIDTLRTMGKIIYLFLDKNTLKKRVLSKILPSYIDPLDPENSFDQMYEKREILYKRAKTFQVDILNKTDEQILEELIAYIQNF